MSLIQALKRQRQGRISEFKDIMVFRVSFRTAWPTQRNPVLKTKKKIKWEKCVRAGEMSETLRIGNALVEGPSLTHNVHTE